MTKGEERGDARDQRLAIVALTCTVFFSAALLFSMEPLVGRLLTPHFGGAAHVWLTCLMFFQAMLLLGYLYAHFLANRLGYWHLLLLCLPMVNLPLQASAKTDAHAPLMAILAALTLHVALPFIALSTTAVVAQTWLFRSSLGKRRDPYPLYAASNAGSLIALIGYAFLVEPFVGVRTQSVAWSAGYIVYILLVVVTWFQVRPCKKPLAAISDSTAYQKKPESKVAYLQWALLSMLPSAFLLAMTNYISLEVGSFPFVWVIPLALYLGSFIVTFRVNGGVPRSLKTFWPELLLLGAVLYSFGPVHRLVVAGHLGLFFCICLVGHGILHERRPSPEYLTNFYLTIAVGGWIGGIFVSLVAPFAFRGLFEYPILLLLLGATFWWCRHEAFTFFWLRASRLAAWSRMLVIGAMVFLILILINASVAEPTKFRHRNFYGTYRIIDESGGKASTPVRRLMHGQTLHGAQLLDPLSRLTPLSYYYKGGPISDVYELLAPSPRTVAVIGLGAGLVSAYLGQNDILTYYEIDPDNERIAREWFTFLNEAKGKVRVVVGDGRLSMQGEQAGRTKYDVILIDAFTGDGIPVHLLTKEAVRVYLDRLSEKGVILFHIQNRYYDLRPVVKSLAASTGLSGAMNCPAGRDKFTILSAASQCVVLAVDPSRLKPLVTRGWTRFGKGDGLEPVSPWTDDHVNILLPLIAGLKF
jgi:spermidine synthase